MLACVDCEQSLSCSKNERDIRAASREPATRRPRYFKFAASHIMLAQSLVRSCCFAFFLLFFGQGLRSYYTATCRAVGKICFSLLAFISTDLTRIFVFSQFTEYLTAFCIQNEKAYPNSKEVNSAFTQQITYARVKASRKAKIVDMTGL